LGRFSAKRERERERVRRKKIKLCEKVEKSRMPCFSNVLRLRRVKSRLAKAAGVEPSGELSVQKVHLAWR